MTRKNRGLVAGVVGVIVGAAAISGAYLSLSQAQENPDAGWFDEDSRLSWAAADGSPSIRYVVGNPAKSGADDWPGVFDAPVAAYDIDGDGADELVVPGQDRAIYVFSTTSGKLVAKLPSHYPPAWHVQDVLNHAEVAVLGPDEPPSIVIANPAAVVTAWRFEATDSTPDRLSFSKSWEHRLDACHKSPAMDAGPTLADVDGDGYPEIFIQTEEVGIFALDPDGKTRWSHCWAGGNGSAATDDLDGDGRVEVVFASDDGLVSVFDGDSGKPLWTFDASAGNGVTPASVAVTPTIAELDGVAPKEILFTARHAPVEEPTLYDRFHMAIFAVHQDQSTWKGELVWMRQPQWANPMSYTRLLVEDVDGDGETDVFGMDWNTIGHYPGDWERLGPAHAFRLDAQGEDVWVRTVDTWWSNKDIALADFDGDGALELLVNGPGQGGDGLLRLDTATGANEGFLGTGPWKLKRGPQPLELQDGSLGIVFPVEPDSDEVHGALLLFDLGVPFRSPIQGEVNP